LPVSSPFATIVLAVDEHARRCPPLAPCQRVLAPRHVVLTNVLLTKADAARIEQHDVGVVAAGDQAAVLDAADHRRQMRDAADSFLERDDLRSSSQERM
jgi:hypothetical protein